MIHEGALREWIKDCGTCAGSTECAALCDGSSKGKKKERTSELLLLERIIINTNCVCVLGRKRVGKHFNVKGNMYNPQKQNLTPSVSAGAS
jgi:hypothetical protein